MQQRIPRFSLTYLFKHVLQFVAILMGWFTGLSRVMDYKHHWSDVLAGDIIGTVVAVFCVRVIFSYSTPPPRFPILVLRLSLHLLP